MTKTTAWLLISLFVSFTAHAHHNWSAIYDVDSDIEIEGVVSEVIWRNPHVRVTFLVDAGTANEKTYSTESNMIQRQQFLHPHYWHKDYQYRYHHFEFDLSIQSNKPRLHN